MSNYNSRRIAPWSQYQLMVRVRQLAFLCAPKPLTETQAFVTAQHCPVTPYAAYTKLRVYIGHRGGLILLLGLRSCISGEKYLKPFAAITHFPVLNCVEAAKQSTTLATVFTASRITARYIMNRLRDFNTARMFICSPRLVFVSTASVNALFVKYICFQ